MLLCWQFNISHILLLAFPILLVSLVFEKKKILLGALFFFLVFSLFLVVVGWACPLEMENHSSAGSLMDHRRLFPLSTIVKAPALIVLPGCPHTAVAGAEVGGNATPYKHNVYTTCKITRRYFTLIYRSLASFSCNHNIGSKHTQAWLLEVIRSWNLMFSVWNVFVCRVLLCVKGPAKVSVLNVSHPLQFALYFTWQRRAALMNPPEFETGFRSVIPW